MLSPAHGGFIQVGGGHEGRGARFAVLLPARGPDLGAVVGTIAGEQVE
jgi:hypothetical protein